MGDPIYRKVEWFIILIILSAICLPCSSIKLGIDGGYDLVFAVEGGSTLPEVERLRLIQNIKASMGAFSSQLWRSSGRQFYVKSVELILPVEWDVETFNDYAESGSFQNADFKLSDSEDIWYPHAANPNICGLPGTHVDLPLTFFENAYSNRFGPIWKTLLVLFAKYRFGVWEEHGFVGFGKSPYFVPNESGSFDVTGCSNEPLVGKFINMQIRYERLSYGLPPGLYECRFVPDRSNTATSSLMHFQWIDSVIDFCDQTNHNKFAENRQNAFCDNKSVMEVIRSSPDYNKVTNPRVDIPPVSFRTVVASPDRILYILLDRGLIQGSLSIASLVPPALASFLQRESLQSVVAAVGSYPVSRNNTNSYLKEEVQWSKIGSRMSDFLSAVAHLPIDGPLERDFSRAIIEFAGLIKQKSHPSGAVILVVKYGADIDNLYTTLPESDVIVALKAQNIILHSIELGITSQGQDGRAHLAKVATATGGSYVTLLSIGDAPTALNNVLQFVNRTLTYTEPQSGKRFICITKDAIASPNFGLLVPIPGGSTLVEIFHSSSEKLESSDFTVRIDGQLQPPNPSRSIDWNQVEGEVKFSYSFRFESALISGKRDIVIQRNCGIGYPPCDGTILATADINIKDPVSDNVQIDIHTSAPFVDLSEQIPLFIYAKATKNRTLVHSTLVLAYARMTSSTGSYTEFGLHDDGSLPDVLENDGIFSGHFVPPPNSNGEYRVSVIFVRNQPTVSVSPNGISTVNSGRLLPIDQIPNVECIVDNSCFGQYIHDEFMQLEEVHTPVVFTNANAFMPRPAKIIMTFNPFDRSIEWRSPRVLRSSPNAKVDSYEIRQATTRQRLLNDFDSCDILVGSGNLPVNNPGMMQNLTVPTITSPIYAAIRSEFNGIRSAISNIKGVWINVETM